MSALGRAGGGAIGLFWLFVLGVGLGNAQQVAIRGNAERGRELFEHVWQADDPELAGDGLGPMFNERSCVACHLLGGIGGAGPGQNNVDLLTAAPPSAPNKVAPFLARIQALHVGFIGTTSTVLHRFSTDASYSEFREQIVGVARKRRAAGPIMTLKSSKGDVLMLSQRNTTPLFGAGLIDSITSEEIAATVAHQQAENPNVTGRFVGRFGWRGQVADLQGFVLGACAVELGLNVPGHVQSPNPLKPGGLQGKLDLTQQQCGDLVEYVASLPAPRRLQAPNDLQAATITGGANTFGSIGCTVCHRPTLGRANGIYSDLLVHDMGARLEDPASASTTVSVQYYGPPPDLNSPLAQERRREWKTPPLWGVRDSAPYLHDGRAATIEEAILWHGGEAAGSFERYQALPPAERGRVLTFLSTLAAPDRNLLAQHAASNR